ncbi:hypothetical protein CTAM01_12976 [Colletotrichum tamarilloi]|uniref:Uncharacterized protein n=1 Tax=Colletotrichum tamarilloi TaxID=1209934 RepID=A0ABQ9QTM0_9PEZI|nr:uncharacterized protein CTAM01_12976 [Colletotrichum tamarilloi]KAK1484471.1 hypothetical protein CTAM01_12976 [Colletotrichum tamarilloi]
MERPHRPPPLTIPPPPRSRTRVRRPRRPNAQQARQFKRWLLRAQIANDVAHVAAASILLWIMSWFLYNVSFPLTYPAGFVTISPHIYYPLDIQYILTVINSPAAVALIAILSTDILLDARSIVHAHDPWPGWTLLIRLVLGASLIAIFWVYISLGDVFARGFTYWGMSDSYGRVLAYMFLWGIGLWDLLFVLLCRHWLGKEVKRYGEKARQVFGNENGRRRGIRGRMSPGGSAMRLGSAGGERPERIGVVDLEAARPVEEGDGGEVGRERVGLPVRMGVRRVKNSVSASVNSVASGMGPGNGMGNEDSSLPPPAFMRPA